MNRTAKKDLNGRAYAKLSALAPGAKVETDDLIDCRKTARKSAVRADEKGGLFVPCTHGRHYLDGQLQADGDTLVGVYMVRDAIGGAR